MGLRGAGLLLATTVLLLATPTLSTLFTLEAALSQYAHLMNYPEGLTRNVPTDKMHAEYDFIVVGAGPGGATVTNRLTEVPGWNVLLLEAGREELWLTDVPVFAAHFQLTDFNWGYRAQPQEGACLGLKDGRCPWPRGKGMGGTSIINYIIYTRGHPEDYDGWVKMGNGGWGWDEVLPYFLKSENANGDFANSPYHSQGGYLDVQNIPFKTKLAQSFIDSAEELGLPVIDYTSGELIGFSLLQVTQRNGSRCSASKAFLRPIRFRPNLHIAREAQVTKVLINPETKKAYGVEFYRNGRLWSVKARKEVILSAGAINTPQLLMLSGVGPREHLESHNITVIHESPGVGNNLQEHVASCALTFRVNDTVSLLEERLVQFGPFAEYIGNQSGPLTIAGGVEGLGYIRTPIATTPKNYPDMELIFISGSIAADSGRVIRKGLGLNDETFDAIFRPNDHKDAWTVWPMILKPESRGWVRLKSKNPLSWPLMYGNYFADEHDLNVLVEGIKFTIEMAKTKAFQKFNSTLTVDPLPACTTHEFGTDEYWKCVVRHVTTTLHHQCGTAKMGPDSDPMAVVDPELKVHGISGLRVIDASIIPRIPAAHTNAPSFMIGEKGADLIKQSYGKL